MKDKRIYHVYSVWLFRPSGEPRFDLQTRWYQCYVPLTHWSLYDISNKRHGAKYLGREERSDDDWSSTTDENN
jgi:hypothetical protein